MATNPIITVKAVSRGATALLREIIEEGDRDGFDHEHLFALLSLQNQLLEQIPEPVPETIHAAQEAHDSGI